MASKDLTTSKNVGQVCGKACHADCSVGVDDWLRQDPPVQSMAACQVYAAANFGQVLTCLIVVGAQVRDQMPTLHNFPKYCRCM